MDNGNYSVVGSAIFLFNSYIYNEKQADEGGLGLASYFQVSLITRGIADIGHPIEGFDANLLILAFPGLMPDDFSGVETLEGLYMIEDSEIVFVRNQEQPASSAQRTVSKKGYETLLENVSLRLSYPVMSQDDVDELVIILNSGERVFVRIDEEVSALGVTLVPQEIVEDSRCPADVDIVNDCVVAGAVRVRTEFTSGLGVATQVFVLNETVTTEAEEVTLIRVDPAPHSAEEIAEDEYVFFFEIIRR